MIFPTPEFTAFFVVVLWISWRLMPHPGRWKPFMLAASYLFYGYADVRFTLLLAAMTVMNQLFAVHIRRATSRRASWWLIRGAVVGNLAVLGWFKYYGFFVSSVAATLNRIGLPVPLPLLQVALPVGVSFFTFQALSYVLDVHRRVIQPAKPMDFAVYLAFFPHLVAGPIVRAREFLPQLDSPRDPRKVELGRAACLIIGGLFKKVVLADMLATRLVDPVFGVPSAHGGADVLLAVYAYGAQIYCDFSGYTDMATGLALLLGFQFPRNFNSPYRATSLQDFWHRWHMTLSRWLRDYLYIPLGGNRRGEWRTRANLMLTMLLGGLWHGAAWNFVIWGGIHGSALVWERMRRSGADDADHAGVSAAKPAPQAHGGSGSGTAVLEAPAERPGPSQTDDPRHRGRRGRPLGPVAGWLVTQHVVLLAWVFFRAPDLRTVGELAGRLWSGAPSTLVSRSLLLAVLSAYAVQWLPESWRERLRATVDGWGSVRLGLLLASAVLVTSALMPSEGVAPFIYFRF
jgi:alginate O-acetyltransferase complex protein AlgI